MSNSSTTKMVNILTEKVILVEIPTFSRRFRTCNKAHYGAISIFPAILCNDPETNLISFPTRTVTLHQGMLRWRAS